MIGFPEIILFGLMLLLPVGCLANWLAYLQARKLGQRFLASDYRYSVPWGLIDMGVTIVIVGVVAGFGVGLVRSWAGIGASVDVTKLSPQEQGKLFMAFAIASLLATALSFVWLYVRFGKHPALGFSRAHWASDVELGIRWFMMLIVPVALLQLLLTRWFPTKHPLVEMLRQSGDLTLLPIAGFAAVISAPLFEEVFFRLLFQGWLEKLQTTMLRTQRGLASRSERDTVIFGGESTASLIASAPPESVQGAWDLATNPFAAGQVLAEASTATVPPEVDARPIIWTPILVSSGLFSLAHFSHGPDWIPLFFLALGLGYLYQRTHRIQACITVHMLVNLLGILQLWAVIRQG